MILLRALVAGLLATALPGAATGADAPSAVVPAEVATALRAAQDERDPLKALAVLAAYKGPEHAYIDALRGQLLLRLPTTVDDHERDRRRGEAQAAFAAALALDPALRAAHLGLAQLAADRGDWRSASVEVGATLDWSNASAAELRFAAQCAIQGEDWRAGTVLVQQGIARFPAEPAFRRLELALLLRGGRLDEARQAILALLADAPLEPELWRQLAWAAAGLHRDDESAAALEVALRLAPDDALLRRSLAASQLGHGMPQAALATVRPLLADPPRAEPALLELAARCAGEAGSPRQGRDWLAAIPAAARTRSSRLLAARLAVQDGEARDAVAALRELVALGERDATTLTWAGQVAEQASDQAAAEAFYSQAAAQATASDQPAASVASLRLVALYIREERLADAQVLLATHLAKRPDDEQAKALQEQLTRARSTAVTGTR